MTMDAFGRPFASMDLPDLGVPDVGDVGISLAVATVAAGAALLGVLAFPHVHRFFHGMRNPVLYVTLGGVVLGVLGAIGGRSRCSRAPSSRSSSSSSAPTSRRGTWCSSSRSSSWRS